MPALLFNKCCGCIELRLGCLIIGYLQLVGEITSLIRASQAISSMARVNSALMADFTTPHWNYYDSTPYDYYWMTTPEEDYTDTSSPSITEVIPAVQGPGATITTVLVVTLLVLIFAVFFTIAMLVGVHKNKRRAVMAYLVYGTIMLAINLIMFFILVSYAPDARSIIENLLPFVVYLYFLLVVRSYYYQMDTEGTVHVSSA